MSSKNIWLPKLEIISIQRDLSKMNSALTILPQFIVDWIEPENVTDQNSIDPFQAIYAIWNTDPMSNPAVDNGYSVLDTQVYNHVFQLWKKLQLVPPKLRKYTTNFIPLAIEYARVYMRNNSSNSMYCLVNNSSESPGDSQWEWSAETLEANEWTSGRSMCWSAAIVVIELKTASVIDFTDASDVFPANVHITSLTIRATTVSGITVLSKSAGGKWAYWRTLSCSRGPSWPDSWCAIWCNLSWTAVPLTSWGWTAVNPSWFEPIEVCDKARRWTFAVCSLCFIPSGPQVRAEQSLPLCTHLVHRFLGSSVETIHFN